MSAYGVFPYVYPIRTAEMKCKERYIGFRFVGKIPKILFPNKDIFTVCYAYFRWLDDIVDSVRLDPEVVRFKIKREHQFLELLYGEKETPEELSTEELFLAHLVRFDIQHAKNMQEDIERLLSALEFDAKRHGHICSKEEINRYIENNAIPYINIALKIFDVFDLPKENLYELGRCGFIIDYINDLKTDIELGYINIPKEELVAYRINLGDFNSAALRQWVQDKLDYLGNQISESENGLNRLSGLAGIFAYFLLRKRKIKLRILKDKWR
ncbi:MAG: squalene/phytoene synthase family protein [Candidatus Aenigmarchaeota archaeon]|nr:squalene/phytoene synthase family protein [Candidatus Aenigmarchaeota archaeon]